jgi:hypothetical protein
MQIKIFCFFLFVFTAYCIQVYAQDSPVSKNNLALPVIPVGPDAYRMWDKWPMLRIGDRAYMRSTYDRKGGNEDADCCHFLFMKQEDYNVTLDVIGKGVVYFFRANHWHGSPWHFNGDGTDNIVKESGTADPENALKVFKDPQFIPYQPFPKPLNWTWGDTRGADLIWTPMPFERSFQIAYSRTRYGTGYYIYHLYANDNLSQPIHSWDINKTPDQDVLDLVGRAGTDIAPQNIAGKTGKVTLDSNGNIILADIKAAPSTIRAFKLIIPLDKAVELDTLRLLITWDNGQHPSVDAPLSLFFGAGTFYNREKKEYLVKGFPLNIRYDYDKNQVELSCYYPMPFFRSAKFELSGVKSPGTEISYEIRYGPLKGAANTSSYFHATYCDIPAPIPGKDMTFLDTRGIEGKDKWSGNFVGMSFIFSHDGELGTLEGDPRFFFDDSQTPQAYGTGTEEWGGGGDYWGGENMTLPFAGHPCGASRKEQAKNSKDLVESAYRFLLADLMPFGNRAVIRMEHGGENQSHEHYEAVTYWYGLPAPSLVKTDELDVGQEWSEQAHAYNSPQASPVQWINSRYEWGVDSMAIGAWNASLGAALKGASSRSPKIEVYAPHDEDGRFTRGTSTFTVKLRADNKGVLLRRTLDYSFPNQKAEIYIAGTGRKNSGWKYAGIWYLAGSNTVMHSDATGELGKRKYDEQTSDRRFRDDEFMIPAALTKNLDKIAIKVKFVEGEKEIYPGKDFPQQSAWSELKYDVYSYIIPEFHL